MRRKIYGKPVTTPLRPELGGKSAYKYAVEAGYRGTEEAFAMMLAFACGVVITDDGKGNVTVIPLLKVQDDDNGNVTIVPPLTAQDDGNGNVEITIPNPLFGRDGKDGVDGEDGVDGKDGYTPVKGVDYWTDADKAEMISEVLEHLPTETWVFELEDGSTTTKQVVVK